MRRRPFLALAAVASLAGCLGDDDQVEPTPTPEATPTPPEEVAETPLPPADGDFGLTITLWDGTEDKPVTIDTQIEIPDEPLWRPYYRVEGGRAVREDAGAFERGETATILVYPDGEGGSEIAIEVAFDETFDPAEDGLSLILYDDRLEVSGAVVDDELVYDR